MNTLALLMSVFGSIFLILSLRPAFEVCRISSSFGWKVLFILICFFIVGYSGFAIYILQNKEALLLTLGVSSILFFGSVFVRIISAMSLNSLQELEKTVEIERFNAQHDYLTKLKNRRCCMSEIAELLKENIPHTLLLLDLNNFKQINDAKGHLFADQVLIELSKRLTSALYPGSAIYRMGGDEFLIRLFDTDDKVIYGQNNAILSALYTPIIVEEVAVEIFYSIGARQYNGKESISLSDFVKQADIAMYCAKASRQSIVIYDDALNEGVEKEFNIVNKLKGALADCELTLYYQPIVKSSDGVVHGVEALLRWPQKNGEILFPDEFIYAAEKNNLIRNISLFVINRAFQDLPVLLKSKPDLIIHINLSSQDFICGELVKLLVNLLSRTNIDPKHIMFELTESMMMTNVKQASELIEVLIEMGFSVSVDDFGTGYSSFSLLKELSISQIKIDKSFIKECVVNDKDKAIIETAIFLANKLGCTTVAEGVETDAMINYLSLKNCDFYQGYKFSKALPLADCIQWIESSGLVNSALRKY